MNKSTPRFCVVMCSLATCVLTAPALGEPRSTPHTPEPPPQAFIDLKGIPGWNMFELTPVSGLGSSIVPHSDGLEPPLVMIMSPLINPIDSLLDDPALTGQWFNEDPFDTGAIFDGTPGVSTTVSAVPAPGSVALLLGAAGAATIRRRRR